MAESHGGAKGTGAHTAADGGHHGGGFPPFDPSTFASQLLWLAITFGVLYLIISRAAVPRIGSILEQLAFLQRVAAFGLRHYDDLGELTGHHVSP